MPVPEQANRPGANCTLDATYVGTESAWPNQGSSGAHGFPSELSAFFILTIAITMRNRLSIKDQLPVPVPHKVT